MPLIKSTFLFIFLCVFSVNSWAQKTPSSPSSGKKNEKERKVDSLTVYMFATSFSFIDSVLYVTNIQTMDNEHIVSKVFLLDRARYGEQLKGYLEKNGEPAQVPSVFFSTKKKELVRQYNSIKKKSLQKGKFIYMPVGEEFKFKKEEN